MEEKKEKYGLWEKQDKSGNPVISGPYKEGKKFVIFKNGYKSQSNHPDYILYVKDATPKQAFTKNPDQEEIPF